MSYHVPRHGPVLDLDPPVAGLEVRPRVLSCAAHEAVDAVELALDPAHRVLFSIDAIGWERPAALVGKRTSLDQHRRRLAATERGGVLRLAS